MNPMRYVWMLAGVLALGLGVLGAALPFLPTVPLVLLAAFCFARSSPRLHDWLITHKRFGPMIKDWQERGAISRRAKYLATVSIAAAFGLSLWMRLPLFALGLQALVLIGVLVFIWSRPD